MVMTKYTVIRLIQPGGIHLDLFDTEYRLFKAVVLYKAVYRVLWIHPNYLNLNIIISYIVTFIYNITCIVLSANNYLKLIV